MASGTAAALPAAAHAVDDGIKVTDGTTTKTYRLNGGSLPCTEVPLDEFKANDEDDVYLTITNKTDKPLKLYTDYEGTTNGDPCSDQTAPGKTLAPGDTKKKVWARYGFAFIVPKTN